MHATQTDNLPITESPPVKESGVPVIRKHHFLVRWSHWVNVPFALLLRHTWLHPRFTTKYNALQRLAYCLSCRM
jgi:hypothetical protein